MAVSDNAVKAAQNAIRTTNWEYGITDADMAKALTAALPFIPVQGAVKKLEWRDVDAVCAWCYAQTPIGEYRVTWSFNESGQKLRYPDGTTKQFDGAGYGDRDAAKAAAQADYEARILSALEPSAARELALEEGYRQGIEAAAQIIETKQEGFQVRGGGRVLIDRSEGDQSGLGYAAAIRALAVVKEYLTTRTLSSPDHAAAGKVEGDGWRPIESAPKDGTVIDLWSDEYGRLTDCYWGAPMAYEGGETGWVHAHSNEWAESPDEFTHWRPLPLPPVKGGQNG